MDIKSVIYVDSNLKKWFDFCCFCLCFNGFGGVDLCFYCRVNLIIRVKVVIVGF